jgi:hypothetical protein
VGWHRPSLPGGDPPSTLGAGGLNCRVRDGTGWTPTASDTNNLSSEQAVVGMHKRRTRRECQKANGSVSREDKPSTISTGWLNALRRVHLRPIQLVVYQRSYPVDPVRKLIWRRVSRLDAFSGSLHRRSLPGAATGVTTGTRALRPPRSSRTRGSPSQLPYAHSG